MVNPTHSKSDRNLRHESYQAAVGFFFSLSDAEYAVTGLRSVGFPLNQITLVGKHFRRQDQLVGVDLCDRLETTRLGIFAEQAQSYQHRLSCGEYMVIMYGTEEELDCGASILRHHRIQDLETPSLKLRY